MVVLLRISVAFFGVGVSVAFTLCLFMLFLVLFGLLGGRLLGGTAGSVDRVSFF